MVLMEPIESLPACAKIARSMVARYRSRDTRAPLDLSCHSSARELQRQSNERWFVCRSLKEPTFQCVEVLACWAPPNRQIPTMRGGTGCIPPRTFCSQRTPMDKIVRHRQQAGLSKETHHKFQHLDEKTLEYFE